MNLFDKVNEDIKSAMKARDKVRLETLRNIKKVFLEAKTAPGSGDEISDEQALKIIQKLAKEGKENAVTFTNAGRSELAEHELEQVKVMEEYLPKQLPVEEVEKIVREVVSSVGATGMKDMGKVMAAASKKLAGTADGRTISTIVKQILG